MALSLDDVKRIAYLARIEIDEREANRALADLTRIFGMIGKMQAVDTDNVEPMSHAQDVTLRLREDKVTESDSHALFQSIACSRKCDRAK